MSLQVVSAALLRRLLKTLFDGAGMRMRRDPLLAVAASDLHVNKERLATVACAISTLGELEVHVAHGLGQA